MITSPPKVAITITLKGDNRKKSIPNLSSSPGFILYAAPNLVPCTSSSGPRPVPTFVIPNTPIISQYYVISTMSTGTDFESLTEYPSMIHYYFTVSALVHHFF